MNCTTSTPRRNSTHWLRCGVLWAAILGLFSPGHAWQQEVRYQIDVRLNTKTHRLSGTEQLWYRNNSPDTLDFVWIHLYPNAYADRRTQFGRELEQMNQYEFSFAPARDRGCIELRHIRVEGETPAVSFPLTVGSWDRGTSPRPTGNHDAAIPDRKTRVEDPDRTEMKVTLPRPLAPGEATLLEFDFEVRIPAFFSRLGHKGRHYCISQWYPKMVVYDPVLEPWCQAGQASGTRLDTGSQRPARSGRWHPDGYHAIGEFYGEFGVFDVRITVPREMVVGATGDLAEVVIPGDSLWNLEAEVEWMKLKPRARPKRDTGSKTLRFHAENVHDFAWVADPAFRLTQDSFGATQINVLVRPEDERAWKKTPQIARRVLAHFTERYGPYPYRRLTVAAARLAAGGGMEYPNLVIISVSSPDALRLLEAGIEHEIGHQWFYGMLGSNELAEAWLDEGINTFAEMRYFEETYGPVGNLSNYPAGFLPLLDSRYYHRMIYHLAATNHASRPILTPAWQFYDAPVAYAGLVYAKAAFGVRMLQQMLGDSCFDLVMQTYCQRYRFRHPTTADFISVVEEVSGRNLTWFFQRWLCKTGECDYALSSVRTEGNRLVVGIQRRGEIALPIEVQAQFADGTEQTQVWDSDSIQGELVFDQPTRLKAVRLDPARKLLETDCWNNYYPRRVEAHLLFDRPSFEAYQLFYGPYAWYDASHGLQLGLWLQGRQFLDVGPLHGRHMWTLSSTYSTNLDELVVGGNYSTPLTPLSERLKLSFGAAYSRIEESGRLGLGYSFGRVFGRPNGDLTCGYHYNRLRDRVGRDTVSNPVPDWVTGRIGRIEGVLGYRHVSRHLSGDERMALALAHPILASDSAYGKASLTLRAGLRFTRELRIGIRLFAGAIQGRPPPQEQFFLSGSLVATDAEPITWSYAKTTFATQENWHIDGDANLRGYIGEHEKGRLAAALNLSLPIGPVSAFFDIGNVGSTLSQFNPERLRMDAGVRAKLGPLYADFPIWANRPAQGCPWAWRWALGLSLSGLSIGGL